MIAWLEKFLSGFAIWRPAAIGKILWVAALFFLFTWIAQINRPASLTTQNITAEKVFNEAPQNKKIFLGLKVFKVGIGVYIE